MTIRRGIASRAFDGLNVLFMAAFCITVLYPFWNLILVSLEGIEEAKVLRFKLTNQHWSASAYEYLLFDPLVLRAYRNTILRTMVGTAMSVFVCSLAAYTLSKRDLPGRGLLMAILLVTLFFSGGFIPTFLLIRGLGLYNTFWVLVLPGLVQAFNIIIIRNFFMAIDQGVEESALMDGATYLRILVSIVMPLSTPVLATVTLWTAVSIWNEWFEALIFTSGNDWIVLQEFIRRMMEEVFNKRERAVLDRFNDEFSRQIQRDNVQSAVILITIGPIVLAYPFLQRYFVRGIMVGSLKA